MSDEFKNEKDDINTGENTGGNTDENNSSVNFVMSDTTAEYTEEQTQELPESESSKEEVPPKEEWYEEAKKKEYNSYEYASPIPPEHKKEPKKKKKTGPLKIIGLTAVCAVVFGLIVGFIFYLINPNGPGKSGNKDVVLEETQVTKDTASEDSAMGVNTVAQVTKNAMPSIVSIVSVSVQELPEILQYFYGEQVQEEKSSGSGIIVGQNDKELLIATNNHVVNGADPLTVIFTNQDGSAVTSSMEDASKEPVDDEEQGSAVNAQVKGTDPDNDLAVISVKLEDIPKDILEGIKIASIGDSNSLQLGEQVVAIGNALGYGQSVTSGYVSALNRKVSSDNADSSFIQTDAAINPGNSGGALLNMKGELIGINSAKIATNEVEGVGFAIPISTAQPILDELMNKETRYKVEDENKAAYIGITATDVTQDAVQVYGMPTGVFVYSLEEDGPADKAGLKKGDVILKLDGNTLKTRTDLVDRLTYYEAGEEVEVVISRQEEGEWKEETLTVTLGAKKDMNTEQEQENK